MDNLYGFVTGMCKNRGMKIDDLQKRLGFSRSTLYRFLKGINQIPEDVVRNISSMLSMNSVEYREFIRLVSVSAFDQTLVEARYVLDDFLFGGRPKERQKLNSDIVYYDNDRYLRTLDEILSIILSYKEFSDLKGDIKIVNCLNEDIFFQIADFLREIFDCGLNIDSEHFVSFSENDYLQNILSFTYIFPLIKHDRYKLFLREKEMDADLTNDTILISLEYTDGGVKKNKYFSMTFFEHGMPECLAFSDQFIYSYLLKNYINLRQGFENALMKYDNLDFDDDIHMEFAKKGGCYTIKPDPCHDKIPLAVFERLAKRLNEQELCKSLSALSGGSLDSETLPYTIEKSLKYIKKRIDDTFLHPHIDVYSKKYILKLAETGKLTDHLHYFPPFDREEIKMMFEYIIKRNNDPKDDFKMYITEADFARDDLTIMVVKGYGIAIDYTFSEPGHGLWKILHIKSKRLASIFCDYMENHVPARLALSDDAVNELFAKLISG